MKKIALLIGGEYRTFSRQFPTWKFLDNFDHDIFMSTWSISNETSDKLGTVENNIKQLITKEKIISITKTFPKYLNIEKDINFEHRGNKQIYHWQKLLTVLINLQDDYEYAIITRPDIAVPDTDAFCNFIETNDKLQIYGANTITVTEPPPPFIVTVNDIFFMSNPKKLIDTLLPVPYMKIKRYEEIMAGRGDTFHTHLAHYFVSNNIYVYQAPGDIIVPGTSPLIIKGN